MNSRQRTNLHQELELLLRGTVPTGDVTYRAAEIAFVLEQMSGHFIECEYGFVNFLKHLECSPELRSDLMRDLVPLWSMISNLQERFSEKECEATIRECARQDAPGNVNVPPSLIPLVTRLLSSEAGGIMVDIGCGCGLVLAQALEEDADLHGEGIDINQRSTKFSEMVISPLKPRGDIYCKSVFDFMVDRIGKYDKVFCFPPIGVRMDRDWEAFRPMLPGGFPHVGTGCSSELVFALTTIAAMKETGRAVVILPEKALCNQKSGAVAVREYLLNSGYLDSVIMLPERILEQMQIGMSLLVFSKRADRSQVTMIDASGLGKKGRRFKVLLAEDVEKIIKAVEDGFCNSEKWTLDHCKAVSYDEIRGSGYNFSVHHYIKKTTISTKPESRGNTPTSTLTGAISGYALVEKILNHFGDEGVAKLLECTNHQETEFLEFKTSYLLSDEERNEKNRKELQKALDWNISKAIISIANTAGGALIIGIGDDGHTLYPVENLDRGSEEFFRKRIKPRFLPRGMIWADGNGGKWLANDFPKIYPEFYPYSDEEHFGNVIVMLIEPRPIGHYIELQEIAKVDGSSRKLLLQRVNGIGEVVPCDDTAKFKDLDKYRRIDRGKYLRLLQKMIPDAFTSPAGISGSPYKIKAVGDGTHDSEDQLVRQTEGHRLCSEFKRGDRIDKYIVEERIGSGGMGVIYRVRHGSLGKEYALKAFKMELEGASMAKDRFRAEAQVLMQLDHPGLPKVYDLDFDEETECYFLVQDLIVGKDGKPHELGGYVVHTETAVVAQGLVPIPSETALKWLRQVCEIADYLHGKGVVHRDITLKNLLIDVDGNVKLTDFGIAKVMAPEIREMINCQVTMTFTQTPSGDKGFLGTLRYLPPEVREKRKADIKPEATDVWAIGISFFKVLTGEWFGSQQFADYDWNDSIWGELLRGMLKVDSKKRMSCAEALRLLNTNSLMPCAETEKSDDSTKEFADHRVKRGKPHCGLSTVPLPDASFMGRDAELKRIREVCENGKIPHVWATGGTGKTQLLLRYAQKYAGEYPGGSFFLQLDGVRSWDRLLQKLVAPKVTKVRSWFGLPEYVPAKNKDGKESPGNMEIAPLESQEIVDSIARKCKSVGPVLLVLDNIDEPKDLLSEDALKKIFPRGLPQGLDIVASARSKEGIRHLSAPNVESVQLHDLPEDVAIALLCGGATDERDLPYIREVLCTLGCRAFYLKKVAYLIEDAREDGYPLPVLKVLRDMKRDLIGVLDLADDDPQSPGVMWHDWALPRILNKTDGEKIAKLVRAIAFYLTTGVPVRILEGLWYSDFGKITGRKILDAMEDDNFRHAIHVIYHYGLVLDDAVNGRAMMHRLDQLAIRKDSEQESGEWIDCIGKALAVNPCMAPADWVELLSADGTWFPFCPWGDLNGQEYAEILSANPDAASYIPDWSRISPHGWAMMLRETTRFDDHPECRFALLNPADVLEKRPELESRFDFSKLTGWQWSDLIRKIPKFAEKCPFDRFSESDWSSFILHDPRLSEIDEIISRNRGVKALESLLQKRPGLVERRSDEHDQIAKHSENDADPIAIECGVPDSQVLSLGYLKRSEHLSAFVLSEWPQLRPFVDMAELRDPDNGNYCLWLLFKRPCFVDDVIWHEVVDEDCYYVTLPMSLSESHVSRAVDEKLIDYALYDRFVMRRMLEWYPEYAEAKGLKKRLPGQWIGVLMDQMRYEEFRMQFNWKGLSENDWYEMFMCSPRSFVSAEWKAVLADHGVSARVKRIGEELMTLNDGLPKVEYLLRELGTADANVILRLPCNQEGVLLLLTMYLDSFPEKCPKLVLSQSIWDDILPWTMALPNPDSHTLSLRYEGNWWTADMTILQIYQDVSDWLSTNPSCIGNGESVEIRHAWNVVAK